MTFKLFKLTDREKLPSKFIYSRRYIIVVKNVPLFMVVESMKTTTALQIAWYRKAGYQMFGTFDIKRGYNYANGHNQHCSKR